MQTFKKIFDAVNPLTARDPVPTAISRGMSSKYLTSLIGTVGSGKTVIASLIFYTARTLQQDLQDFHCDIDDRNSTMMADVCNIEGGHFPPKTKAYNTYAYQCALHMWWGAQSIWGKKAATFQVCDIAGEDLATQSQYQRKKPDRTAWSQAARLVDYIYRSDIFILAAPASRAPIFENDQKVEVEKVDLAFNPDVNLSSIFAEIVRRRREQNNPIKGIILCLTKCDMIDKYVEAKYGWNLYQREEDRQKFLNKYFPWTTMKIKSLQSTWASTQVISFPMFIQTKKDSDGKQVRWTDGFDKGNPKIEVKDRIPQYNAKACAEMINFVGRLVG